ncbi:MAG: hypothetical protein KF729_29395 [Sandaracinaceae bacterium]|nr:hypothetical protein [Sandaracinaceae bacterium]
MKGRLEARKKCEVSIEAPTTNTELVTIDITWTVQPPAGSKLMAAPGGRDAYSAVAAVAKKAMTLRLRIEGTDTASVKVISDGKVVTDETASAADKVWTYATR